MKATTPPVFHPLELLRRKSYISQTGFFEMAMKRNHVPIAYIWLMLVFVLACRLDFSVPDQAAIDAAAAQTVAAMFPSQTPAPPTITPQPTSTATLTPTATPQPCDKAEFVSETIPDRTEFNPNESFTKTWRLKNIGTCTWNTSYRVAHYSGDRLGGPAAQSFTQIIKPGEKMDVVLQLKAPSEDGKYISYWKLQDEKGVNFAQIYVWIEVE